MNTRVAIPNHDYPPDVREAVAEKLRLLDRFQDQVTSMKAILLRERDSHHIEIVAKVARGGTLVADVKRKGFGEALEEAVERMDTLLEQLLEFARFRAPARTAVELGPLVDEALAEHREELTRRGVRLERNGAVPGPVDADRAQVLFALRSLLGGLVHELIPHEPLKMTVPESGAFEFEAHAEPATVTRLTAFVEGADTETAETPTLPFALAAALLERNGGSLRVRKGAAGATVVRVALAPVAT